MIWDYITNNRLAAYLKARIAELSSKFALGEAAAIAALQAAGQMRGTVALVLGILVFAKFFTPDPKGTAAGN